MDSLGPSQPLSLGLCALRDRPVREAVALAAGLGYRAVQLDARHEQVRPRALDRSARRDLAAVLRRHELSLSGIDLWLPPEHLCPGPALERAAEAVQGAMALIRDLAGLLPACPVVSLTLPARPDPLAMAALQDASHRLEVALADHAWPPPEDRRLGLDPALVLLAGESPARAVARLGDRLASVRLSDADTTGRAIVGSAEGRLDVGAYAAALAVSAPSVPIVADVRQLPDPLLAARRTLEAWRGALVPPVSG
ncbi:MAG: hypothetical protein KatS3mg103_0090 [Phycisphaerales bacterium]|nr:MAG: hypothetical protein KatS3mg103_0090 [Phycisphaerales bacterium]